MRTMRTCDRESTAVQDQLLHFPAFCMHLLCRLDCIQVVDPGADTNLVEHGCSCIDRMHDGGAIGCRDDVCSTLDCRRDGDGIVGVGDEQNDKVMQEVGVRDTDDGFDNVDVENVWYSGLFEGCGRCYQ